MLGGDELLDIVGRHDHSRPLVVEITEHQAVEDYNELDAALGRLREHGVRVAVDDVGSGFASFRHVTRVNPEILKLDRSLVCGIDEDPVRQSLASAIVSFARDVGAIVVSEGIESGNELDCLVELSVGCGQGFYLARPGARSRRVARAGNGLAPSVRGSPARGFSKLEVGAVRLRLVACVMAVGWCWAVGPAWADGPGVGTPAIVALGDSAISGEAGRWAGNTNNSSSRVDALGSPRLLGRRQRRGDPRLPSLAIGRGAHRRQLQDREPRVLGCAHVHERGRQRLQAGHRLLLGLVGSRRPGARAAALRGGEQRPRGRRC